MTSRQRLRQHLEAHLPLRDLPDGLEPELDRVWSGVAPYAVRLAREWRDAGVALSNLEGVLEVAVVPDPLMEPLLRWGERLAVEAGDDALRERFARALERYRARFAAAHALEGLGDALTDWALAGTPEMRPYAAAEAPAGRMRITLLRLRDPVSARFDAVEAHLSEIGGAMRGHREIVLELSRADAAWLRGLDARDLTLRFVLEDRYIEVSTRDGDLYDVEVNPDEARIYLGLRNAPADWGAVESAVVMAPPVPGRR